MGAAADDCGSDALRQAEILFLEDTETTAERVRRVSNTSRIGIIVLSANPKDARMIELLEAGADDYLPVPLNPIQLIARVLTLLRRTGSDHEAAAIDYGSIRIRRSTHEAFIGGQAIQLTPHELHLLYQLAAARGDTVTRGSLQKMVWDSEDRFYFDALRKHIERLRKKLHAKSADLDIVSIRGVGYRLVHSPAHHQASLLVPAELPEPVRQLIS